MKRIISLFLGLAVGFSLITLVMANGSDVISVVRNSIKVMVDGQEVNTDKFLYQDITYIPLRDVTEKMGCIVEWDEDKNEVHIFNENYQKKFKLEPEGYKGVKIEMNADKVKELLGEPKEVKKTENNDFQKYEYIYDECIVGFWDSPSQTDEVLSIKTNDKSYKTLKGVSIGDKKVKIIRNYGLPFLDCNSYICYNISENNFLEFDFDENSNVKEIIIDKEFG